MNIKKICLVSIFAAAIPVSAYAADLAAEITTAQNHAGMASKAADIKTVQMHLHHVLNCLVGPSGDGYDPGNANPCAKSGGGAIPDSNDSAQKTKLLMAVNYAKAGLSTSELAAAQEDANDTATTLAGAK